MDFRNYLNLIDDISTNDEPNIGDIVEIEMGDQLLETYIEDLTEDGVIIKVDEAALSMMIDAKKQLNEWMKMGASSDASAAGSFYEGKLSDEVDKIEDKPKSRRKQKNELELDEPFDFEKWEKSGKHRALRGFGPKGFATQLGVEKELKEGWDGTVGWHRIDSDHHDDIDDGEYNDEAGMFKNDLQTLQRVSAHLEKEIQDNENLPEWCQAKIAQAKGMVVNVMDYMISQHENGDIHTIDEDEMDEAKYHGREVPLGKKMKGDVKKSKVYVRKPNGNIVKVEFGDPNMRIKKSNPKRRKSFRARHHCENPGPRWKARYWSCRAW